MMSGDEQDGSQDDVNDEVKYSTRPSLSVDCWKLMRMMRYLAPAGIDQFRTMKIHCSYHQTHFHIVVLLSKFHCFLSPCNHVQVAYIWIH